MAVRGEDKEEKYLLASVTMWKARNQFIQLYTMKFTNSWLAFTNKLSVSDFQKSLFFICLGVGFLLSFDFKQFSSG